MAIWQDRLYRVVFAGTLAAEGLGLCIVGCNTKPGPDKSTGDPNVAIQSRPGDSAKDPGDAPQPGVVNFDQPFEEAVITDALDGEAIPPDVTFAGKKTALLHLQIEKSWPKIKLTDSSGKPIAYHLQLDTAEGPIEIQLRPEIAPNHVRNILALAQAGYYDGLVFERTVHQESEVDGQKSRLDMVIAGCPMGTGDDGFGHIGYFVRSEFQQNLKHEGGTVGFWHEEHPDSAGCRFYITLGPAPVLDGKFTVIGSVTQGLDVVRRIASRPVQGGDMSPDSDKPVTPIVIKKATVTPEPIEKGQPVARGD